MAAACGRDRALGDARARGAVGRGTDAVVLRAPRTGVGRMTAAVYPQLDSVVWRSSDGVPAIQRVLSFDAAAGRLAALDVRGFPTRIDLRLGTARVIGRVALGAVTAAGGAFFGLAPDGAVTRLTDAGDSWRVRLGEVPQALYAQRDGSVLAAAANAGSGRVWLLRPPATSAAESTTVPGATAPITTGAADGVYFAAGDELLGVHSRGLRPGIPVMLGAAVRHAVATPSGDRLYVLTARAGEVQVVDRYADRVATTIVLPAGARDLRMDPLGRYVVVRPAHGDSAWVLAVGTDRVVGATRADWRDDLPLVLPDGAVAAAVGPDVVIVDGETLRPRRTVAGGASDLWHVVLWNGFRPRAGEPVPAVAHRDASADAVPAPDPAVRDSAGDATRDSAGARPDTVRAAPDSSTPPTAVRRTTVGVAMPVAYLHASRNGVTPSAQSDGDVDLTEAPAVRASAAPAPAPEAERGRGFTVQFAAAPTEREALATLRRLALPAPGGRVVPRTVAGQIVYRVVAGPFATRAEAERVRRSAGRAAASAWIYGGAP